MSPWILNARKAMMKGVDKSESFPTLAQPHGKRKIAAAARERPWI